jgi:hypothetical protein
MQAANRILEGSSREQGRGRLGLAAQRHDIALKEARKARAPLTVSSLDRLSRNVHLITGCSLTPRALHRRGCFRSRTRRTAPSRRTAMSGNAVCASTTYRGFVLRKYFRTYNRLGARWYLLAQLSHYCNFEETVRMSLRMSSTPAIPPAPTPAPTPSAYSVSKLVSDSERHALACFAPVRLRHSNS